MIRTLIIDDEPPARSRMKRLLAALPECEFAGEAGSARQALEMIPELKPDLLLLDISMPGMDGMALARTLQTMEESPEIIFCTAWTDQALDAFECNAVDYLVKPVRPERLQLAIDKVLRVLDKPGVDEFADQFLRSTVGGKTKLVSMAEVICLIAEDKYTTVIYELGKVVINDSLIDLEKRFPDQFLRVHRNTLVTPRRIRGLERLNSGVSFLNLEGTDFKPEVSRRQLAQVRKFIRDSA
ncbi:MAG: two-component system response regulator AlgR [Lysobacterales bacterium]|jgi:two-component system response regulator AlgR